MRKFLLIILVIGLLISSIPTTHASPIIVENPKIKIVIDGKIGTYENTPIILNDRSLLPLRALLANLGVKNDDEHIIWNQANRSITIMKDDLKIFLKVDSTTALVNDKEVPLPVAPIIYKDRTFIPTRFVSECLSKKVVWDESSSTILIKDEKDFNQIKDILDKSDLAMSSFNKYKMSINMNMLMSSGEIKIPASVQATASYDKLAKTVGMNMEMNMLGQASSTQIYIANNTTYVKDAITNLWQKQTMSETDFNKSFTNNTSNEALCAGLKLGESTNPDELILKGDVYFNDLFNSLGKSNSLINPADFNKFYLEVSINKVTNVVKSMKLDLTGSVNSPEGVVDTSFSINSTFSDFNGDFQVTVPQDALTNAVEIQ